MLDTLPHLDKNSQKQWPCNASSALAFRDFILLQWFSGSCKTHRCASVYELEKNIFCKRGTFLQFKGKLSYKLRQEQQIKEINNRMIHIISHVQWVTYSTSLVIVIISQIFRNKFKLRIIVGTDWCSSSTVLGLDVPFFLPPWENAVFSAGLPSVYFVASLWISLRLLQEILQVESAQKGSIPEATVASHFWGESIHYLRSPLALCSQSVPFACAHLRPPMRTSCI